MTPPNRSPLRRLALPRASTTRRYYYIGSQRIALRENVGGVEELYFFLADHLGSTAVTADDQDNLINELYHKPFGSLHLHSLGNAQT
jgi:hypothetical protein